MSLSAQLISVVDASNNEPLIGVNVYTQDMSTFTGTTDLDGKIKIPTLNYREVLTFSYIGYTDLKVPFYELRRGNGYIKLSESLTAIDTLVVVGRKDERVVEMPYLVDQITAKEIEFKNPQTTADALANEAGVFVQKSQMGGGSPVIRGFEANRVLLVVDGVRMNNAIYRNGHLQNAITIDNSMLEQIEVIYGPGSLTYGSDALGGVVHFRTRDPQLLFSDYSIPYRMKSNLYTRFSSANLEKTFHYDLNYGNHSWGSITSISYSIYDDLRAGAERPEAYPDLGTKPFYAFRNGFADEVIQAADPNIQHGTAYNQFDFLQKIKVKLGSKAFLTINGQYSTTSDVPRYDRLTETSGGIDQLKFSEWYYGPQERILGSLKFNMFKENFLFDKGTIIASAQKVDEDRFSRKFGRSSRTWNSEDLLVYGLTIDFSKDLDKGGNHNLGYGFDGTYNDVKSRVLQQSVITGRLTPGRELTRYPSDGSTLQAMGTYLNYRLSNSAKTLFLDAGLRYSWVSVFAKYKEEDLTFINWDSSFFEGIQNDNQDLSWALGLTWNSKDHWQFRALTARAFRAPNVDDLFKNRIKNDKAVIPNVNLQPETARSTEVTLAKTIAGNSPNNVKISLTGFYTELDDAIVRRDGQTPDGETQIVGDGGQAVFDVQQNFNTDQATIYGASGNVLLKMSSGLKIFGGINYTKGETTFIISDDDSNIQFDTLTPMSHIPPVYGRAGLSFEREKFRVEGVYRFNGKKPLDEYAVTQIQLDPKTGQVIGIDREGSSDNLLETGTCIHDDGDGIEQTPCEGTLAWSTLNFYSTLKLGKVFSVDFAVENILDVHYRPFSSGVSAAGRNFILTVRAKF